MTRDSRQPLGPEGGLQPRASQVPGPPSRSYRRWSHSSPRGLQSTVPQWGLCVTAWPPLCAPWDWVGVLTAGQGQVGALAGTTRKST